MPQTAVKSPVWELFLVSGCIARHAPDPACCPTLRFLPSQLRLEATHEVIVNWYCHLKLILARLDVSPKQQSPKSEEYEGKAVWDGEVYAIVSEYREARRRSVS